MAATEELPPWEVLDGAFLPEENGWMEALLDDDIVQNGPCARVAPLPKRSAGGGVCFRSDDRRQAQLPLPAPLGPSVVAMAPAITSEVEPEPQFDSTEGTEELRAESDLLADCGAVALCAPLSSLEGADPATRAAALHLARWFRARLSGQSVDGAKTPEKTPSTPRTTDDMDLCRGPPTMPLARKDSGGNDDWGAATCYGRLEGTSPCRTAPVFDLAVKAPKAPVAPHQSGYQRLALNTEVRDDVFENARADACAQLASSALRSCFRLKAAAPEVRLLLELCDDRGDGDDGPKAAKKAFHARCAYLANGAGARSLRKERWRARAVATARGATLHDYAVRDESGLLKPACSPDLRDALLGLEARGVSLDDVCVCVEAPACADAKAPGSSRFAKHLPWSPWSAAGHLSRVLSVLRDSVLKVVEGSKEEPQVDVQPPKRQRGARTKPKMDVEAQQPPPSPEFRDVASFTSFFGERCTVHAAPLRRVLGTWSAARFLYANLATIRREAVALAAQRARVLAAAERRGGDKPALVEFDLNPRDFAYRTDGGVAVADRYLLVYPKTERSVFILALRRCA